MPIALLEALAHGLPVVATRVGAVPDVIAEGRQGLLVPPRRPGLLADAMRNLARDLQRRKELSCASRRLAQTRFSLDRLRADLLSLYDDISAPSTPAQSIPAGVPARAG
jgi:glycosyltransferase involved in cell wall biosynthesis